MFFLGNMKIGDRHLIGADPLFFWTLWGTFGLGWCISFCIISSAISNVALLRARVEVLEQKLQTVTTPSA